MKKTVQLFTLFAALLVIGTIASCTRTCDLGYEGDHCVDPVRAKFLGTFSGSEACAAATDTFSVAFSEVSNDVTKIRINNINNLSTNAIGTVLENGSISLAQQSFGNGGTINGSLTMVAGKIQLDYHITFDPSTGSQDITCTWVQN
ncbi:MAG TPA: hypothetical protein VK154_05045 [Chitinophagales bacterium]|nr:hypothetical protein [Chitinophagales bacterium]